MKVNISGDITSEVTVTTTHEWMCNKYENIDFDDDDNSDVIDAIYENPGTEIAGEIIALQCSLFYLTRAPYLCGSTVDIVRSMISKKKRSYEEVTGEEFIDYNEEVDL